MNRDTTELFKLVLQVLAILCLVTLVGLVAHKAFRDISVLAQQYSGGDFWAALVRHVLRNLAGS